MKRYIRFRYILMVVWGLCFCFNLIVCLNNVNVNPISWVFVGIPIGVLFILLTDTPLFKAQEDFTDFLMNHIKKLNELFDKLNKVTKKKK